MNSKQSVKELYFNHYHVGYCEYIKNYLLTDIKKYVYRHNLSYRQIDIQDAKSELKVKLFEWIHNPKTQIQHYPAFLRKFLKYRLYDYLGSELKEKIQKQRYLLREKNRMIALGEENFGYFDPDYTGLKELCRLVCKKLQCLDKRSRGIFSLKVLAGYTFCEISELFHLPESTVKTIYYKTVEQLKSVLDVNCS